MVTTPRPDIGVPSSGSSILGVAGAGSSKVNASSLASGSRADRSRRSVSMRVRCASCHADRLSSYSARPLGAGIRTRTSSGPASRAGSSSCCRTSARSTAPSGNRSPSSRLMTRSILLVSAWSIASASSLSGHNQQPDHPERTLRSTSPARRILAPCRGRGSGLPLSAVACGTTMAVMDDVDVIAERYRTFADLEARGSSPSYEAWSRAVAGDRDLLAQLATLPVRKHQPNLVFAALRWHGERPGDGASLRHGLLDAWGEVRPTILGHATQTNEPARCAG